MLVTILVVGVISGTIGYFWGWSSATKQALIGSVAYTVCDEPSVFDISDEATDMVIGEFLKESEKKEKKATPKKSKIQKKKK